VCGVDSSKFWSRRLLRNAEPELDFRYFSKVRANSLDSKAAYHAILNGALRDKIPLRFVKTKLRGTLRL